MRFCAALAVVLAFARSAAADRVNAARGRPCSFAPPPNYALTTDPADRMQLTDGRYASGTLWTKPESVGWVNVNYVFITLDLGADTPIAGASFNTAAGAGGALFPTAVIVLVSTDGHTWHAIGDLVAETTSRQGPPPAIGYAVHKFWTDQWRAHGRWVAFVVDVNGPFCFADEVEVYEGQPEWRSQPLAGAPLTDLPSALAQHRVRRRIDADARRLRELIETLPPQAVAKDQSLSELERLRRVADTDPAIGAAAGRSATLPFPGTHADMLRLQATYWRARGIPPFSAWVPASPYDPLPYLDGEPPPTTPGGGAAVAAMRGETRPVAVDLANARDRTVTVTARVRDLTACADRSCLQVVEAVRTDTSDGTPVALALRDVERRADGYRVQVPSGMTAQLWFRIRPGPALPSGDHQGHIVIDTDAGDEVDVPLAVHVAPFDFPTEHSLHLGGWDYTDRQDLYGLTSQNRDALATTLQEYLVDLPWASPTLLGPGRYDRDNRMIEPPSTAAFDAWVSRWPRAYRYQIFVNAGDQFDGARIDTPPFRHKVSQWVQFWRAHAQARGLRAGQLVLALVDEPHTAAQDARVVAWGAVIKQAAPDVLLWENPTWPDPRQISEELLLLCDVLCPPRTLWLRGGRGFVEHYTTHRSPGARIGLYSTNGPSSKMDPYAYYRLQAWQAFAARADEMHFWSFGDNGGGSPWQPYVVPRMSHSPLFLAPDSVTPTKQMEAIRDGVADYETLTMLRAAVTRKRSQATVAPPVQAAEQLLTDGVQHVLAGASDRDFVEAGDRTVADKSRVAALHLLEQIGE